MDIIKDLKEEHERILVMLDDIDKAQNLEEKKEEVRELRAFVAGHLKKEDEQIYPALRDSGDDEKIKLGYLFSDIMKGYTTEFLNVADDILSAEEELEEDVIRSYEKIRDKIKDRVTIEETILFPAFLNK